MSLMKDRFKNLIRSAKNSIKDYNPAERRVRAATSNEPWPPSSRMMIAICHDLTDTTLYDSVLVMMLKRLQDKGQVMHIRKALQLVEFCLRHGSRRFVEDMRTRQYIFKVLTTYRFLVHGQDKGAEVRSKAAHVMQLLGDDSRLEQERLAAKRAGSRMQGISHSMVNRRTSVTGLNFDSVISPSIDRPLPPPSQNLSSPSATTTESVSLSDSSSSSDLLPIAPPPRKRVASDSVQAPDRGGRPALPDNPFDQLSSLFDAKAALPMFDWDGENDNGNTRRSEEMQNPIMNGGLAAAPQELYQHHHGQQKALTFGAMGSPGYGEMGPHSNDWLMVRGSPEQQQIASSPGWYQQPQAQQQQPYLLPYFGQQQQRPPTQPILAILPPAEDPRSPFL